MIPGSKIANTIPPHNYVYYMLASMLTNIEPKLSNVFGFKIYMQLNKSFLDNAKLHWTCKQNAYVIRDFEIQMRFRSPLISVSAFFHWHKESAQYMNFTHTICLEPLNLTTQCKLNKWNVVIEDLCKILEYMNSVYIICIE